MKLRYLATVVFLAMTTVAAHAQVGLYLNPIAIRVSNSTQDTGPYAFLGPGSTERTFWGANFGGYYDFLQSAKGIAAGIDLRQSVLHANNAALKEFFFGVRISARPANLRYKPYIQASIGAAGTKSPSSAIDVKKVDYRFYGGLDYTLQRHLDFRALEVGYGTVETISSATVGGGGNIVIPASSMLSVSSGLVFHF